jgi:hypothetical protein
MFERRAKQKNINKKRWQRVLIRKKLMSCEGRKDEKEVHKSEGRVRQSEGSERTMEADQSAVLRE